YSGRRRNRVNRRDPERGRILIQSVWTLKFNLGRSPGAPERTLDSDREGPRAQTFWTASSTFASLSQLSSDRLIPLWTKDAPAMPATADGLMRAHPTIAIEPGRLEPSRFSRSLYGDPAAELDDLLPSIRA